MDRDDIIKLAHKAGLHLATDVHWMPIIGLEYAEKFAALVAAAEREKVARWMMERGYSTGHGDTTEDLLQELDWQIAENWNRALINGITTEREACAKVCDEVGERRLHLMHNHTSSECAAAIRARGQE
jgi:hypothetical protein